MDRRRNGWAMIASPCPLLAAPHNFQTKHKGVDGPICKDGRILAGSFGIHPTFFMSENKIEISELFAGIEDVLEKAIKALQKGERAMDVSEKIINPSIGKIEENAGQRMDALYVTYFLDFTRISE